VGTGWWRRSAIPQASPDHLLASPWRAPIEAQFQALRYFAIDGTDHDSHEAQSRMIRRYIAWRNRNTQDKALREIVKHANVPVAPRRYYAGRRRAPIVNTETDARSIAVVPPRGLLPAGADLLPAAAPSRAEVRDNDTRSTARSLVIGALVASRRPRRPPRWDAHSRQGLTLSSGLCARSRRT
jgi:hypothetical protein